MFVGILVTPLKMVQNKKIQHAKNATEEKCKTKTLQRVKEHHDMVKRSST